ncbi:HNH endonuclease signature motif containing protein [Nocardia miyunensis]|uniref:HNH endonuclease signature motif containing protein n=1 Tax=Nocardia miyunensis TaxID=282684 RepID=UPI00083558E9|nr:HNH endonuclease signature motif containing protein [Nocardia miyunensis]
MHSNSEQAGGPNADALLAAVGELVEQSLTPLPDRDVVELMRGVERAARMLVAVQHRVLIEVDSRSIPADTGAKTIKLFLMETLRLSNVEAGARVRAATRVGTFCDMSGAELAPELPCTAIALRRGDISVEHARRITAVMVRVPRGVDAADREAAEKLLAEFAATGSPDDIGKVGQSILAHLDPDGRITDEDDRARMRGIRIGRQRPDGMSPISGEIDPVLRALLDPVLAKYARPGVANPEDPTSPGAGVDRADPQLIIAAAQRDTRTAAQRTHDAFTLLLRELVDTNMIGAHRGIPVTTVLTIRLEDVEQLSGVATTATGGTVAIPEALRLAERSRPYLAVFDHAGLPLHFGRMRRLASPAQRLSLIAALSGCSRPGCDAPASLCAVHHVHDYSKGGPTDIENLVLACDHCHSLINDSEAGWKTVVLGDDSEFAGRTAWIAPEHIDPTGTPRVNHRHRAGELLAQIVADIHARRERERGAHRRGRRPGDIAA